MLESLLNCIDWIIQAQTGLILGKLLLSVLAGMLIGYEREVHGQAAGLRTNILVCLAGCLLMIISIDITKIFESYTHTTTFRVNPGRIASYAVAGMGFLGAGAIIKGKGSVRGLTTAASLWMVTALGLAIGAGFFIPAILTLLFCLPVLYNLRLIKPDIIKNDIHTLLSIKCSCIEYPLNHIREVLNSYKDVHIESINYFEDREYCTATYTFRLISKNDLQWETIVKSLLQIESILEISWQEADVP